MTGDGPIVEEVRRRAMEISAQFNHDLHAYAEHLRRRQRDPQFRNRIVSQVSVVQSEANSKPIR